MLFVPHQPFCHLELHRNKEYRQHHWKLLHGYIVYLDKKTTRVAISYLLSVLKSQIWYFGGQLHLFN
jgi:hypothetical protein